MYDPSKKALEDQGDRIILDRGNGETYDLGPNQEVKHWQSGDIIYMTANDGQLHRWFSSNDAMINAIESNGQYAQVPNSLPERVGDIRITRYSLPDGTIAAHVSTYTPKGWAADGVDSKSSFNDSKIIQMQTWRRQVKP